MSGPSHQNTETSVHSSEDMAIDDLGDKLQELFATITLADKALEQHSHENSGRGACLRACADALRELWRQFEDSAALRRAVELEKEALLYYPSGDPVRVAILHSLAESTFKLNKDIDEAIAYEKEALGLVPSGHPGRPNALKTLAGSFFARSARFNDLTSLDEGIQLEKEILELCPPGHDGRASALAELAASFMMRFKKSKDIDSIRTAVQYRRDVVELYADADDAFAAGRSEAMRELARCLIVLHQTTDDFPTLDECCRLMQEALTLCPPGHPDRLQALKDLSVALRVRCSNFQDQESLDDAIYICKEILDVCPPNERAEALRGLAAVMHFQHQQASNADALNKAVWCEREVLDLCPPGHDDRARALADLSKSLIQQSQVLGDPECHAEASTYQKELEQLRPSGASGCGMLLEMLRMLTQVGSATGDIPISLQGESEDGSPTLVIGESPDGEVSLTIRINRGRSETTSRIQEVL